MDESTIEQYTQFYTVVRQAVTKTITVDAAVKLVDEALKSSPSTIALFVDTLCAVEEELAKEASNKTSSKLVQSDKVDAIKELRIFSQACVDAALVPSELIRLSVDAAVPDQKDKQTVGKRRLQIKTRLFYKQVKFNLLREENEGYAKLIVDLCEECDSAGGEGAVNRIQCLIGQFNLDPNRVVDIVLECFERRLDDAPFFCFLLKEMKVTASNICNLLSFKFDKYQGRKNDVIPRSLYEVSAALIVNKVIQVSAILPHVRSLSLHDHWSQLAPTHSAIVEAHGKEEAAAQTAAGKSSKPSALLNKHETNNADTEAAVNNKILLTNQKLGLLAALMERGEWTICQYILGRLPEFYAFAQCPLLVDSACAVIDKQLSSMYTRLCGANSMAIGSASPMEVSTEEASTLLTTFISTLYAPLTALGPHLGHRPRVHMRVARVMAALFSAGNVAKTDFRVTEGDNAPTVDVKIFGKCVDLLDSCIVPALSVMQGNAPASECVWTVLSQLPYTARYRIYARWSNYHPRRHAVLAQLKSNVRACTSYNLKRLSKETVKQIGRQLCKLIHVCPSVVFDQLLTQVQTFDNFIGPTVDSIKLLTPLEYDLLCFSVIEHLCRPEKQKLKASDAALSPWLTSLSTFVAHAFKRYDMQLTGVLQYIANELKDGNNYDLLILRDIVLAMSGVELSTGMTKELIHAASGGPTLCAQAGRYNEAKNVRRATGRLREALFDNDLAVSLCILIAQQRACLVYDNNFTHIHLKLLSQLLDQCQETLVQFGEFLRSNVTPAIYDERVPSAGRLIANYHLPLDAAMFLARPKYICKLIARYDELKKDALVTLKEKAVSKKVVIGDGPALPPVVVKMSDEMKQALYVQAFDSTITDGLAVELDGALKEVNDLTCLMDRATISPVFLATFWTMTSYDMVVPHDAYKKEIERLTKVATDLEAGPTDKNTRRAALSTRTILHDLEAERESQTAHVARFEQRLAMPDNPITKIVNKSDPVLLSEIIIRTCLLPRAKMSDVDATYCCSFVRMMYKIDAPAFPTLNIIYTMLANIAPVIACVTDAEMSCLGILYCDMFAMINHWHRSPELLQKMIRQGHNCLAGYAHRDVTNLRLVFFHCHFYVAKCLTAKLVSGSYVEIRNALMLLMKILPQFPMVDTHNTAMESKVKFVMEKEKETDGRQDLAVLAASYLAHLKKRKGVMLIERNNYGDSIMEGKKNAPKRVATKAALPATASVAATVKQTNGVAAVNGTAAVEPKRRKIDAPSDDTGAETIVKTKVTGTTARQALAAETTAPKRKVNMDAVTDREPGEIRSSENVTREVVNDKSTGGETKITSRISTKRAAVTEPSSDDVDAKKAPRITEPSAGDDRARSTNHSSRDDDGSSTPSSRRTERGDKKKSSKEKRDRKDDGGRKSDKKTTRTRDAR